MTANEMASRRNKHLTHESMKGNRAERSWEEVPGTREELEVSCTGNMEEKPHGGG